MKGDFSRWNGPRDKNYAGVLHQQGRVLLDRDWNDQAVITNAWQDLAARQVIGYGVAAVSSQEPKSLQVTHAKVEGGQVKLEVQPGNAWADGLKVQVPEDLSNPDAPVTRTATYLEPPFQAASVSLDNFNAGTRDAVVLEVWRETLNAFQTCKDLMDPEDLIEPALGGPDTTERLLTAKRFRLLRLASADESCPDIAAKLQDDWKKKGKLKVTLRPTTTIPGDCPVVEGGGYVGFEHCLYRIEMARVNQPLTPAAAASQVRFKWSQCNGGLVGRGQCDLAGADRKITITANDQAIQMSGLESFYLEVVEFDAGQDCWRTTYGAEVSLNGLNLEVGQEHYVEAARPSGKVFFRLWNGIKPILEFPKVVAPTEPFELNDGIRLEFDADTGNNYQPEDYWAFPVRAGDISHPDPLLDDQPPEGIHYHRVPLAILNWNAGKDIAYAPGQKAIEDCRHVFRPLTQQTICCTFVVGDGVSSHGDFDSLEEAVEHLPEDGGEICLLPGYHRANVLLQGRRDIRIRGCDHLTLVVPRDDKVPIFQVIDSTRIVLEHLDLDALRGQAIVLETEEGELSDIEVRHNRIHAGHHAIFVNQGTAIAIRENHITMADQEQGDVAIFMLAQDSLIEGNEVIVVPAEQAGAIIDEPDYESFPNPLDPCADAGKAYKDRHRMMKYHSRHREIARAYGSDTPGQAKAFMTRGGIQIGGTSARIAILRNRIIGGCGNGITLGHIPRELQDIRLKMKKTNALSHVPPKRLAALQGKFESFLSELRIEENEIRDMGLNGIGVVGFFNLSTIGLLTSVVDLTIYRNLIHHCLKQLPAEIPAPMKLEMGFGGIALADCENLVIRENRVEHNGKSHLEPVSGIFLLLGEKVDISDNRILNNGPRTPEKDTDARPGLRGGIVIGMSFKPVRTEYFAGKYFTYQDGIPAVKIHNNIITQPLGQALFIMAMGPVSVVGNQLTSQGADFRVNPLSALAGAVMIFNLGVSKDLLTWLILSSIKQVALTNVSFMAKAAGSIDFTGVASRVLPYFSLPSGNVLFANNQTTLDLSSPEINFALSSLFIFSLDDVSYSSNQSECISFVDIVVSNTVILAVTIRTNDNRFQEGLTRALFSLFSYGLMNTTTANQATHCLHALGHPLFFTKAANKVIYSTYCAATYQWLTRYFNLMVAAT